MAQTNSLPDNLISRLTRVHVASKSFVNSDGQTVEYQRLVLGFTVKGKESLIETKLDQKDITLLELSDTKLEREALDPFNSEKE